MSSPAIVTGGSGWLGRRLVKALHGGLEDVPALSPASGRTVRCLALNPADREIIAHASSRAEPVSGDLRQADSLTELFAGAQGATVFHCAGVIHPRCVRDFYVVNVEGTRVLLEAARRARATRFVHVSSNSPLGFNADAEHRFDENSPYNPYRNYGRSKKEAEDLVNAAHERGEIETVIVRPPWFYGPGQPPRQTEFFSRVRNGRMPMLGDGTNRRSMAYVDNIVQGLLLCERTPRAAGRTYWIADRRAYSMSEIVATVADVLERDFRMEVSRGPLKLPGIIGDCARLADRIIQGVGLYNQRIHVLSDLDKSIACSIDRAEAELGYDPKVELREGMVRSVRALLEEGRAI